MCITVVTKLLLLSVFAASVTCNEGEYYWRPWTSGSPPSDAFTIRDYRGLSYIVEAYVPNYGLYVGHVFANQHEVSVSVSNSTSFIIQTSKSLKVLCTQSPDKLAWYPTYSTTFSSDLVTGVVNPVLGGINNNNEVAYIGRFVDYVSVRPVSIGSIVKDNNLHIIINGKVYTQAYYEILVIASKCKSD